MSKFLLVGLGNIGDEYADTRHNIGFDVLFHFIKVHGGKLEVERLAYRAEVKWKGHTFICICPTTFMNLSGRAFRYWIEKEKIKIENTLTVVDDLALPLEKIRLRPAGTHAGHNGLKDIQAIMGTDEYPKLRFGIGNKFPKGMQSEFVLGKWRKEEIPLVKRKIEICSELIEHYASIGIEKTMGLYNNLSINL
jgi:peptidyl-tRNA hydrolase, PTH1 family